MTSRGTPLLYYGDEIAMPGGADPDNRRDFPGGFAGDARNAFTAQGRTAQENEVWNHLARLGALRKELKPLQKGETLDLLDEEQQMAYVRVFADQAVLMIFNNDTKAANVSFDVSMIKQFAPNATLTDRLGRVSEVKIENGAVKLSVPARTAGIFTVK
jgi:glycosidase